MYKRQGANVQNIYGKSAGIGIQVQPGSKLFKSFGYSSGDNGIFNNGGFVSSSLGNSDASVGLKVGNGSVIDSQGISSASFGIQTLGTSKFSNISGYSSGNYGVIMLANGVNITGYSAVNSGIYMSNSGGSNYIISGVTAISDGNVAMYIRNNSGNVKLSNINVLSNYNNASGHGFEVDGIISQNIQIAGGSISVLNASANCLFAAAAKTPFFANLTFTKSTTPISSNITNSQTNTPDSFNNILLG